MEKITFPPLVDLLKERAEKLNHSLQAARAISSKFNPDEVSAWFSQVIEPVFKAAYKFEKNLSIKLFDFLFADMISVLSGPEAGISLNQSQRLRRLIALNPGLFAGNSAAILNKLSAAFKKIIRNIDSRAADWLSCMEKIVPMIDSADLLLTYGKIAAWRCGLAYLHRQIDFSNILDQKVLAVIFAKEKVNLPELNLKWDKETSSFIVGGFVGLGGLFIHPPKLAIKDGNIFASDSKHAGAIFADRFGQILYECSEDYIATLKFCSKSYTNAKPQVVEILSRYKDLTSWAYLDSTLYLTTASSHSVFLFGAV